MPGSYKQVTDPFGNVTYVAVTSPIDTASDWLNARSGETSTLIGAAAGTALAPTIFDNASKAVIAGIAGDYISAATYGIPAVVAIYGALAAIIKHDKPKGPTDAQIKTHVAGLSRDELISLLQPTGSMQPTGPAI